MRIIKFLIGSLLFFALAGGATFLIGREILLMLGTAKLKSSVSTLNTIARNTGSYLQECRQKLGQNQLEQPIEALQLRFTSDTTYQLEVVCQRFYSDPIIISEEKLPPFVTKIPGYSGLIWGDGQTTSTGLEIYGRQSFITLTSNTLEVTSQNEELAGPVTSCGGYGYTCCNPDTSQGQGEAQNHAVDCPATCFPSCVEKPVVLALTTEPFYDPRGRIVTAAADEPIAFNYIISPANAKLFSVKIDYGDGQSESTTVETGQFTHAYACSQPECRYTAAVSVVTDTGIVSVASPLAQVQVVIRR